MKESRKEFIKKVHSAASNEWKKNIEKEFPKLFKEDDLKVGKWYKYPDFENWKLLITDNTKGKEKGVGFNCSEIWMKDWLTDGGNELSSLIPCSDEEVKEALIKEAKRRGFKKGVKFIRLSNGVIMTVDGLPYFTNGRLSVISPKTEWSSVYKGGCSNPFIFDNGKWAEIIETITKEQAEKELGKTILN
jgi:hypothetical protein